MRKIFLVSEILEAGELFIKNPLLILPSIFILLISLIFTLIASKINPTLTQTYQLISFTTVYLLILLAFFSFFFVMLISLSMQILKDKISLREALKDSKRLWLKNLLFIVVIIIAFNIIRFIAQILAQSIGTLFSLELKPAQGVFFILYFIGLVLLLFLSLANFELVKNNSSLIKAFRDSFRKVKNNYPFMLSVFVFFFVINELLMLLNENVANYIGLLILTPLLSLILSKLVAENDI